MKYIQNHFLLELPSLISRIEMKNYTTTKICDRYKKDYLEQKLL